MGSRFRKLGQGEVEALKRDVRGELRRRGWGRKELAGALGLSEQHVSALIGEKGSLSWWKLREIMAVLELRFGLKPREKVE